MTLFASRENSPAEQRAIETLIVETFDATEIVERETGARSGVYAAGGGSQWDPRRNTSETRLTPPTATGLERARELAAQAKDYRESDVPEEPARPNWDQPMLFEDAA